MIDYILGLCLLALIYFIYLIITFLKFRKRLLKEFMNRGLTFEEADILYTKYAKTINKMNADKVSISKIVDEYINN